MAIRTQIITLNVNELSASTKRHRLDELTQKSDLYICCPQETHFNLGHIQTESKGMEKVFNANGIAEKAGVVVLISEKIDIKKDYYKTQSRILHNDQVIEKIKQQPLTYTQLT